MCRARINSPTGKSPCVALLEQVIIVRVDKSLPSECIIYRSIKLWLYHQVIFNESDAYFCQFKATGTISDFMFDLYDLYLFVQNIKTQTKELQKLKSNEKSVVAFWFNWQKYASLSLKIT